MCIKDRDLLCGSYQFDTVTRLISERCQRVIVILSPAFLKSPANEFFTNFALNLGMEQQKRKILPCVYEPCEVPAMLRCQVMLDFRRSQKSIFYNFWEKFRDSIRPDLTEVQAKAEIPPSTATNDHRRAAEQTCMRSQLISSSSSLLDSSSSWPPHFAENQSNTFESSASVTNLVTPKWTKTRNFFTRSLFSSHFDALSYCRSFVQSQ